MAGPAASRRPSRLDTSGYEMGAPSAALASFVTGPDERASHSSLRDLVSRYGITPSVRKTATALLPTEIYTYSASHGDLSQIEEDRQASSPEPQPRITNRGGGGGRAFGDASLASHIAIAEVAERYATGMRAAVSMIRESANGLGGEALDLDTIPRCSQRELASGKCSLRAPAKDLPIRWVKGVHLAVRRDIWVPAIMVYHGFPLENLTPGEHFWFQISTGCAVHTSPQRALASAICEVIERDAIAISWLQRLELPPLDSAVLSSRVLELLRWLAQRFVAAYLFNATTDLGVPTVYCLQIAPHAERAAQVVACATDVTLRGAAEKALLESMTLRTALHSIDPATVNLEKVSALTDGAAYTGQPSMASAFRFLTGGLASREPSAKARQFPEGDDDGILSCLLDILRARDMNAIAVNVTADELSEVGLTAVRVIIPELQPLSLLPFAQYLGHPRLYDAPRLMGYPSLREEDLNPWPQPFA
jgi:ribosomal protein S12 methylthiotransferase accessory factor